MKVYVSPHPNEYAEDGSGSGGIWRIINAQAKWLPKYGVEIVDNQKDADLVHIHAGALIDTDKPIVQGLHGYYWTGDFLWGPEYWQYNANVIEVSRRASAILSPSEWISDSVRRDLRKSPVIIPHGVDPDLIPLENEGYVLWGKPRVDIVCDPRTVNVLAEIAPAVSFVTTFGRPARNVRVVGTRPHREFISLLGHAAVWLATARETGDIASREAMLMGVPVLGWDHGATAELVRHKEAGYLAAVGDYNGLLDGLLYCLEHRDELGAAAREYILKYSLWEQAIAKYAAVYRDVLTSQKYECDISVIIPSHNYANFLPEAIESVRKQSVDAKIEIIVVDDCSTDNTQEVISKEAFSDVRYIRHDVNRGLCGSLNTGHRAATGKYLVNLDADNLLPPDALQLQYEALEKKPWIDVASGSISIYSPDGKHRRATDWPFGHIDPLAQLSHINQLPSSSMMRAESVKRLGGYRLRQRKNEDGEFWCRAVSAGLWMEQVTQNPILVYRWHDRNKSKLEGGEDPKDSTLSWNYYYPWATQHSIMPFACTAPAPKGSWPVRSYANPHISVIIPCGPGHDIYLPDALDSIAGQDFQNIECIVANDTGKPLDVAAMGHPWVRVVNTLGKQGPSIARNTAIHFAKAPLIVPLDADDLLYQSTLGEMYSAWLQYPGSLVYMDCDTEDTPGRRQNYTSGQFSMERVLSWAIYQDVILFAKDWWRIVGGYPVDQPFGWWEDWIFGVRLHILGIGASYVPKPWGVYRHWTTLTGGKSKNDLDYIDQGTEEFKAKVKHMKEWVRQEEARMPCRGCGGSRDARVISSLRVVSTSAVTSGSDIRVVYAGDRSGSFGVNSRAVPGRKYHIEPGVVFSVVPGDAWIADLPDFREVKAEEVSRPEYPESPPAVKPIAATPEPEPAISPRVTFELPDDLGDLPLSRGKIDALKEGGLLTKEDIKLDIKENEGKRILAIPGFGEATLRRLRNELG